MMYEVVVEGSPVAILTAFGWTLAGSVKSIVRPERLHVVLVHRVLNVEESLSKQVEDWWEQNPLVQSMKT